MHTTCTMEPITDFYQFQVKVYQAIGAWKLSNVATAAQHAIYNYYFWFILIGWILSWHCSLLIQLFIYISDLSEIIQVFYIAATALAVLGKYLVTKLQYASYTQLFESMHSAENAPVNAHEVQIMNRAVRMSRKIRNSYICISLMAANGMLISTDGQLPFSSYIPLGSDTKLRFYVCYVYQYIAVMLLCITNIGFDSMVTSLFIYLQCQLEILAYRLAHIGSNIATSHDIQRRNELIGQQLKGCVRYYQRIIKCTALVEAVVSKPLSAQIFCSILVLIANFYGITILTDSSDYTSLLKYVVYQICMISQIFMVCLFANNVTMVSANLAYMVYEADWIVWAKTNRRLMLLMMNNFNNPIRINSINRCYSFNLMAFTSIVNSSYSYFALLKNTSKS